MLHSFDAECWVDGTPGLYSITASLTKALHEQLFHKSSLRVRLHGKQSFARSADSASRMFLYVFGRLSNPSSECKFFSPASHHLYK